MKRAFGELELAILNIMRNKEKTTVREVYEALGSKDKYTTVMTVMNRLVEKKVLQRNRIGLQYEYWLTANEKKSPNLIERLKKQIFGGRSYDMISYLIESGEDLTAQELHEMEKLIEETKKMRKKG